MQGTVQVPYTIQVQVRTKYAQQEQLELITEAGEDKWEGPT